MPAADTPRPGASASAPDTAAAGASARLVVHRAGPEGETVSCYEVPYTPGQSVLDGLRYVRAHLDPTLAVRHSCINANTCKECMIQVDGKVGYACTARLEPRDMVLRPLANKAGLRDLVTEIGPPDERLDHAIARGRGQRQD